jgi:hypothetical protein
VGVLGASQGRGMLDTPDTIIVQDEQAVPDQLSAVDSSLAEAQSSDKPTPDRAPDEPTAKQALSTPTIILVGADKGGVGKTMVTRTLLDFLAARDIPHRAFDTEAPKGTLKRFHPDVADVIDVSSAADQMKIFDTINASEVTVLDVRAGQLSSTLKVLEDIGFLNAARNGDYNFAVFHILGPTISSLEEISDAADQLTGAHHFLVKNFINNTTFFGWDPITYNGYFNRIRGLQEISVPRLNEMACERVEMIGIPFTTFIANQSPDGSPATHSFVLRGYVRHWLQSIWAEYDRVGLADLVHQRWNVAA